MRKNLRIFKALCDETRLKILYILLEGEKCVCEIVKRINRSQPAISSQLAKLEDLGIVSSRRAGKNVYYRLVNRKVIEILKIMEVRDADI